MLRQAIAGRIDGEAGFRWRGGEVSRTENLSDAVFGFAITLLVVSLEVPRTFADLQLLLRDFIPFGVCVAVMGIIWHAHYRFFRRYGLNDGATMFINTVLLFVVVFYLYPLKFLTTMLFEVLVMRRTHDASMTLENGITLLNIYSVGYAGVFLTLSAFYVQAWRRREDLELDPVERLMTLQSASLLLVHVVCAVIAIIGGQLMGSPLAGGLYFLIGPFSYTVGVIFGRRLKKLKTSSVLEPTA